MDGTKVNELERQASEASLRALAEQESRLRDLRSRAGALLAAASLSVSFLGVQTPTVAGADAIVWAAIGAFVVTLVSTVYLLLPNDRLVFAVDGAEFYVDLWDVRHDGDEVHRRLAYWMTCYRRGNQPLIDRLNTAYRVAAVALLVQVGLWGVLNAIGE